MSEQVAEVAEKVAPQVAATLLGSTQPLRDPATRAKVLQSLINGESMTEVAATLGITRQAVAKFRKLHFNPALTASREVLQNQRGESGPKPTTRSLATAVEGCLAVAKHVARIERHQSHIDRVLKDEKDGKVVSSLIGTDLRAIELSAKLDGSLTTVQVNDNSVHIAMMLSSEGQPAPQPMQLAQAEFTDDPEVS